MEIKLCSLQVFSFLNNLFFVLKNYINNDFILYFNSFALSIKMNVLLFFPAFGLILFKSLGAWKTSFNLLLIILIQIILALPFLMDHPKSYFTRAFEFSRVFIYKWTVNWKFLDEEVFVSSEF